jgi:hypothetical protein
MFNNETFGDYLIYAAWPQYKVFVDGRNDMYGVARMMDYDRAIRASPEWQSVVDKYSIDWVLDFTNSPLSLLLLERRDWRLIYADKVANIFLKDSGANQQTLGKFSDLGPLPQDKSP